MGELHSTADLVRDILSAFVSGLLLLAVNGYLGWRRDARKRIEQHAKELRDIRAAIAALETNAGIDHFPFTT